VPFVFAVALLAATVLTVGHAGAETYQLVDADGTVHFTNAPNDPQYRRVRGLSGTAKGWLRVPPTISISTASLTDTIRTASQRYGVPEDLVSAVIRVESGFNARAVSSKGARGLMQLMPGTAAILGVRDSFDPTENIDGGVRHLRGLLERFGNNLPLVLAAYNAGEGAVTTHRGIPPYPETQAYVGRILSILGGDGTLSLPSETYRYVSDDGAVVYTNIPPRGVRARR
jgi:Transglycosylase SLT domain/Domain of unknown function (DUF4124)